RGDRSQPRAAAWTVAYGDPASERSSPVELRRQFTPLFRAVYAALRQVTLASRARRNWLTSLEGTREADRRDRAGWRAPGDGRLGGRRRRPAVVPVRRAAGTRPERTGRRVRRSRGFGRQATSRICRARRTRHRPRGAPAHLLV